MSDLSKMDPPQDNQAFTLIVYRPEGSTSEIQLSADLDQRTIWVTQRQIASALDLDVRTVNHHIQSFKQQSGPSASRSIRNFRILADDGKKRDIEHYDMTIVVYVGFRAQATQRVVAFRDWVGRELDRILNEKGMTLTPAELILAQAKRLVEHERGIRVLEQRQEHIEGRLDRTEDRLTRVEARQTTMIDAGSQHMTIRAYCLWKNIDSDLCTSQRLAMLNDKAKQLSRDKHYPIGKAIASDGYENTFHLDILNEIFVQFR